jgi:hypothetical protein
MPILNYTTSIESKKSISEIQDCLAKHGATKITVDYVNLLPSAVTFCLEINGTTLGFSLPAKYLGVLKAMQKNKKVPRSKCTEEQAQRVAWRIVKDWVEAQMALTEAQLAEMAEVFLPYAVTKNGNTLYNEIKDGGMKMLTSVN